MTGIEALHDAIQHHEGWYPGSVSNRNRNPGNLRNSASVTHTTDAGGYCVFTSVVDGSRALLQELKDKVTGNNLHHITPDSTLDDLFNVYAPVADKNQPHPYALAVALWCTQALGRPITSALRLRDVCRELFPAGGQL